MVQNCLVLEHEKITFYHKLECAYVIERANEPTKWSASERASEASSAKRANE